MLIGEGSPETSTLRSRPNMVETVLERNTFCVTTTDAEVTTSTITSDTISQTRLYFQMCLMSFFIDRFSIPFSVSAQPG